MTPYQETAIMFTCASLIGIFVHFQYWGVAAGSFALVVFVELLAISWKR